MKLINYKTVIVTFLFGTTIYFSSCRKEDTPPVEKKMPPVVKTGTFSDITLPTLTTADVTSITSISAISGGTITDDGGGSILAKGISWSTTPDWNIYLNDSTVYGNGSGSGSFVSPLSNLKPGKTYFVKAFAVNSVGIAFGSTLSFIAGANVTDPDTPDSETNGTVTDIDGNVYKTVRIGNQTWMAENLKTTKYKDGTAIPYVTDNTEWSNLTTGGYSWYSNNAESYKTSYGALYNWYAVTDSRNLCPSGWHVPSDSEWTTLNTYLGGSAVAGGKLKEAGTNHWLSPNTGANNSSGWTGFPGGVRRDDGLFVNIHFLGLWWTTSKASDPGVAISAYLNSDISNLYLIDYSTMNLGSSVRCVRN
jgi:uncharacterized protein (TIGR02145 family)